jgi:hypothetical protein
MLKMLNGESRKNSPLTIDKKKLKSTRLICQTRDMNQESEITTQKITTIYYEV